MQRRWALWFSLMLVSFALIGCGGGGDLSAPPPDDTGYVDPGDSAE